MELINTIDAAWEDRTLLDEKNVQDIIRNVIDSLDQGKLRVAEKKDGAWHVNEWVKKAVYIIFPNLQNGNN